MAGLDDEILELCAPLWVLELPPLAEGPENDYRLLVNEVMRPLRRAVKTNKTEHNNYFLKLIQEIAAQSGPPLFIPVVSLINIIAHLRVEVQR